MSIERLYARIVEDTHIWNSPIHGTEHWIRVRDNALYLAKHNNGDPKVVEYFAILHDSQRWNEHIDPEHGPRAADYAKTQRSLIDLSDEQFTLLQRACAGHTHAKPETTRSPDPTLACCWDADRLDIGRVGIKQRRSRRGLIQISQRLGERRSHKMSFVSYERIGTLKPISRKST